MEPTPSLAKAELIVHSVRLRIIEEVQKKPLTSQQLSAALRDVPQASLYRHIKRLADGGILQVVEERLINGIVERVYAMKEGAGHLSREEFAQISPQDHARYFAIFLGNLSGKMNRYLEQPQYDTTTEGMTYFQALLPLTDEEARQVRLDLLNLVERAAQTDTEGERRPRLLAVAFVPEALPPTSETLPNPTENEAHDE